MENIAMITAGGDQEQAVVLRLGTKEFETYSRSLDKRSDIASLSVFSTSCSVFSSLQFVFSFCP